MQILGTGRPPLCLCLSACLPSRCGGRDQVAEKTFGLSEVVASPRAGRKSGKAGADSARKRVWDRGRLFVLLTVALCGSVKTLLKDRVGVVRVFLVEGQEQIVQVVKSNSTRTPSLNG